MYRDISPIDYAGSRCESEVHISKKYTLYYLLSRHLTLRATIRLDPESFFRDFIASPSLVDSRADHKRSILEISVEFCLIAIDFRAAYLVYLPALAWNAYSSL